DREPAREPRRCDAQIGLMLREMQDFVAVREQSGTAFTEIQLPGPELGQVRDEASRGLALVPRKLDHLRDELLICKASRDGEKFSSHDINIRCGSRTSTRRGDDMKSCSNLGDVGITPDRSTRC